MTRATLMAVAALIAALAVPMILGWVPPNPWYGLRVPATLKDPNLWYVANRFGGWALLTAMAASFVLAWLMPERLWARAWFARAILLGPLVLAVLAMLGYVFHLVRAKPPV